MKANGSHVTLALATKILGASEPTVKRYAQKGLIGVQCLPGLPTRYCREDLESLRDRCTIAASAEVSIMGANPSTTRGQGRALAVV